MGQLTLFDLDLPYKYIIDTSSILSQKEGEQHDRRTYKTMWNNIEALMKAKVIITCSEVLEEIQDKDISDWLKQSKCIVIDIDDDIQDNVSKVVTINPQLIDFKQMKSSGDAFLIATAMKYNLTVITEENKKSSKKIPYVCNNLNVKCININELCVNENWQF